MQGLTDVPWAAFAKDRTLGGARGRWGGGHFHPLGGIGLRDGQCWQTHPPVPKTPRGPKVPKFFEGKMIWLGRAGTQTDPPLGGYAHGQLLVKWVVQEPLGLVGAADSQGCKSFTTTRPQRASFFGRFWGGRGHFTSKGLPEKNTCDLDLGFLPDFECQPGPPRRL